MTALIPVDEYTETKKENRTLVVTTIIWEIRRAF